MSALKLVEIHLDTSPPESGQVVVADLRADRHAAGHREIADAPHRTGITGVEPAGHIGAADHFQQGGVVAQPPHAEALAEVGVQVDHHASNLEPFGS